MKKYNRNRNGKYKYEYKYTEGMILLKIIHKLRTIMYT